MKRGGTASPETRAKQSAAGKRRYGTLESRFWAKVEGGGPGKPDECWNWIGSKNSWGYGQIMTDAKTILEVAHRVVYRVMGLPLPPPWRVGGPVLDHTCRNRACVNPAHHRLVSPRVNALENNTSPIARNAARVECFKGHPFTPENTAIITSGPRKKPTRVCLTCRPYMWRFCMVERHPTGNNRKGLAWIGPKFS